MRQGRVDGEVGIDPWLPAVLDLACCKEMPATTASHRTASSSK